MDKEEYYKEGRKNNLPLRCPILNYCTRRAFTIYFNSDFRRGIFEKNVIETLQNAGELPSDFEEKCIDIQGESPVWNGGRNNYHFNGMCPEVNLFDNNHSLFLGLACVEGSNDNERTQNKKQVHKCQHFSECPEFNRYAFDQNASKKIQNKKKRKTIPQKTKALLQKEIKSKCPNCSNEEVDHFQIHHIDENPENNEFSNLLMLCPTCHSKITKKDISMKTVIKIKKNLQKIR